MTPDEIEKLPYRPCVGLVVMNRRGEIFAGQRLDYRSRTHGKCRKAGSMRAKTRAMPRCVKLGEETGIAPASVEIVAHSADWIPYELPHDLVPKLWKGRFRGQTQQWFLMRFLGDDSEITIETPEPEFREWAWMAPETLIEKIVPFKRATYETVLAEFADRIGPA